MIILLIVCIGLVLAGFLAVGFGIPVKEFSFGNTLIVTGVVAGCTGAIMLGFWIVVRELKILGRRLGVETGPRSPVPGSVPSDDGEFSFTRDQGAVRTAGAAGPLDPASGQPWHEAALSQAGEEESDPESIETAPASKRRNLLFSSISRKERERSLARSSDPVRAGILSPDLRPNSPFELPPLESDTAPPATFEDAWPKPERSRPEALSRRTARSPNGGAPPDRPLTAKREDDQAQVTVLKSGIVDGMAYSLYSDGSIEAQMPEGMMRFASIEELRSHLDQRP